VPYFGQQNTTKQIIKPTSYQVPTATCFSTTVPFSDSLLQTKDGKPNTVAINIKILKMLQFCITINQYSPFSCNNSNEPVLLHVRSCQYYLCCVYILSAGISPGCSARRISCQGRVYLLTPRSRVLFEKLTSELCS
jgi:uncharacterized protein (DUF486 family)